MNHLKGYECIKILIAIRLSRLKGLKMYKEGVALKRKSVFPLFRTINVCGEREGERERHNKIVRTFSELIIWHILINIIFFYYYLKRRGDCSLTD